MNFLQTTPGEGPVVVEGIFDASPERVFSAWTKPGEVMKWFCPDPSTLDFADIDLRTGGKWCFAFKPADGKRMQFQGEYLEIEKDQKLVFSWFYVHVFDDGRTEAHHESRVSVTFEPRGNGTYLRLLHEAIDAEDHRKGVGHGWDASFANLQELVSQGK